MEASKDEEPWDWRTDYIVCEHIAKDRERKARHSGFRVCCEGCYPFFLFAAQDGTDWARLEFRTEERDGLTVGRVV